MTTLSQQITDKIEESSGSILKGIKFEKMSAGDLGRALDDTSMSKKDVDYVVRKIKPIIATRFFMADSDSYPQIDGIFDPNFKLFKSFKLLFKSDDGIHEFHHGEVEGQPAVIHVMTEMGGFTVLMTLEDPNA